MTQALAPWALAALGLLCLGCQAREPTVPAPSAPPAQPTFTRAPPPEFATVQRDSVVLGIGRYESSLRGPIELIQEPDDADPSYLARRDVDEATLPEAIRAKRRLEVTLLKTALPEADSPSSQLSTCTGRLGGLSAYGWAHESQGWGSLSRRTIQQKTFTEGTRYLAAALEDGACPLRRWVMFSAAADVRFWSVRLASERMTEKALLSVRGASTLDAQQAAYARFVSEIDRARSGAKAAHASGEEAEKLESADTEALPTHWFDLRGRSVAWTVESRSDPKLLVGLFERRRVEFVPNPGGAAQETLLFEETLVVIWQEGAELGPMLGAVRSRSPEELSGFDLRGGVSTPGGLPALLFHAYFVNGVLRPVDGEYLIDDTLMMRPAEPK